jgi:alkylated DNA repair dioxygenase AlkB
MNLFDNEFEKLNILPIDGEVNYYDDFFDKVESDTYFKKLKSTIDWNNDEIYIFGKHIITNRKVAWYGEDTVSYTYSRTTKFALPWTKELLEIKSRIEDKTGENFNACLLNFYHDGNDGMGWHSDDEDSIVENSCIASLSFGATRKFVLKHKIDKETISLNLNHGSLLTMKGETQKMWMHSLAKSKKILLPRINLTFRKMKE